MCVNTVLRQMSSVVEYESQIFLEAFNDDGLLIMARGLGIDRIMIDFVKVYSEASHLVLVLNTTSQEEEYFIEQLEQCGVKPIPKVITNEYSASDRQRVYLEGGVLFITSRILVVDLLTDRVPVDLVSGILVYKAHRIIESCQEAFILRLYRQKNKEGFIKAFSENPNSFTTGFCHVERMMKNLFVKKLFLWPRFQSSIISCFEKHKVELIEYNTHMTPLMKECQRALLDLIDACIKELKRCITAIDIEEISVENAIGRSFDKIIRLQLDPIWNEVGPKVRQLVTDLKTLRQLLQYLTQYDCVTFFNLVNSLRTSEKTFGTNSGWLFLDSADNLYVHAKSRVYGVDKKKKNEVSPEKNSNENKEPHLEECPKWQVLSEILQEIDDANRDCSPGTEPGRVLIAADDDNTCSQLKEYLCDGGKNLLKRLFNKSLAMKSGQLDVPENRKIQKEKARRGQKKPDTKQKTESLTLTQMVGQNDGAKIDKAEDKIFSSQDAYYGIIEEPVTVIHPLHGCSDVHGLSRTLEELKPSFVVLYDPDLRFCRELEVFRASNPGKPLRVYFLMYKDTVEEQRYLTSMRKEKEAFEFLIREKATMVITEEQDGKIEGTPALERNVTPANLTVNSRKGGTAEKPVQQKVIVDMREFRSELPSLIHRRGIDIEPVTIDVGDYILTPDLCVERKSVSDLIGSLNNGRLYNQCISMCRYYKRPILLIEFDANKSFSLQGKYPMSNEVSIQDVSSRLSLLTLHFPKLRILWCQSPYATAEIFEELKRGRPQPDVSAAISVAEGEDGEEMSDKYSHGPQDFLLRLPGVSSKNYRRIMNKVENLSELSTLDVERLTDILGNEMNAKKLWNFFHSNKNKVDLSAVTKTSKTDNRKTFKRKR